MIVTGTTDCRDANTTTAKINDTAHSLLTETKKHTQSVIISSVLPRIDSDNPGCQLKINTVNENIRKLYSDNSCTFVEMMKFLSSLIVAQMTACLFLMAVI